MFQPDKQGEVWLGLVFALVCKCGGGRGGEMDSSCLVWMAWYN